MDPGFFYETVAPLLLVGVTSLICISTLTSEINFYTRLFKVATATHSEANLMLHASDPH